MQQKAVYLLFCKFTLHASGANHTHIIRSTQNCNYSLRYVQLPPSNVAKLGHVGGR